MKNQSKNQLTHLLVFGLLSLAAAPYSPVRQMLEKHFLSIEMQSIEKEEEFKCHQKEIRKVSERSQLQNKCVFPGRDITERVRFKNKCRSKYKTGS